MCTIVYNSINHNLFTLKYSVNSKMYIYTILDCVLIFTLNEICK